MGKEGSSTSVVSICDSETSDFVPDEERVRPIKRRRVSATTTKPKRKGPSVTVDPGLDIEDAIAGIARSHDACYHDVKSIAVLQEDLLAWFEGVREKRGMPWRKRYDPGLNIEEKGQRAYEIWVSEVMLQQTQVATVIAYWQRWMEKWPTIADLAKADIEEVNAAWRGLGYYRRARSLLAGAKTVAGDPKYKGRLPHEPDELEKEIEGVGRYTAGAICSMAYGVRAPIVDGNVHRLLTRLLAAHAPQTAPQTIKFLWAAATELVEGLPLGEGRKGIAGDWNQALMELGSQICKPVSPECGSCPLRTGCKAYAELKQPLPPLAENASRCVLCAPIPAVTNANRIPSVTVFPMRKDKKVSRTEEEVVSIVEWRGDDGSRKWLFVKRPDKGLLAGLFEPLTTPVSMGSSTTERFETATTALAASLGITSSNASGMIQSHRHAGSIPHIFSHINMTYHILHLVLASSTLPLSKTGVWLDETGVETANIGTGVKKVWAEVYGAWGSFDSCAKPAKGTKTAKKEVVTDGKVVKKVMMPQMPMRAKADIL